MCECISSASKSVDSPSTSGRTFDSSLSLSSSATDMLSSLSSTSDKYLSLDWDTNTIGRCAQRLPTDEDVCRWPDLREYFTLETGEKLLASLSALVSTPL